jgi:hypothetical protein
MTRDEYEKAFNAGKLRGMFLAGAGIALGAAIGLWLVGCASKPAVEGPEASPERATPNPSAIRAAARECEGRYKPEWCPKEQHDPR